jgi:ABC-type lipoprotein export system ATPase subunit
MPLLALERVRKRYQRGVREVAALEDVSLELSEGDLFGVLGGARSGKTTLLRIAAGIETPDQGTVRFLGRELATMSARDRQRMLRCDLGCVWRTDSSQRRLPAVDHVALPLIGARWSRRRALMRAHELLRRVDAADCAEGLLPELSTSELVRVSIAQALVRDPQVVLADEPTDTLNMIERDAVFAILRSAAAEGGVGILLTSGDVSGLIRTNRVAALEDGRLLVPASDAGDVVDLAGARGRDLKRG